MRWYLRVKTACEIVNGYIETNNEENEQNIISRIYNEHKYIKLENNNYIPIYINPTKIITVEISQKPFPQIPNCLG